MMKILKSVNRTSTEFTSFQLRAKHPEAFARIIRRQTEIISNNHVIIVNNVSKDTMYYLSDRILSVDGVSDVIRVPNSKHLGKHKILWADRVQGFASPPQKSGTTTTPTVNTPS